MEAERCVFILLFSLFSWSQPSALADAMSPIVIVPGLLGSQIWGRRMNELLALDNGCQIPSEWHQLWINLTALLPSNQNCTLEMLMLYYNTTTGQYENYKGLETEIPGFGNTDSIETLDDYLILYFYAMVEHFVHLGYERGKTIRAAPYDWRYSADQLLKQGYYSNLKSLIEETYTLSGNKPVTLVVHSLGAPTSLFFLTKVVDQVWKDTYIKAYVTLSGAWHGAAKVVMATISGYNEGLIFVPDEEARFLDRSYLSSAWLLPYPSDTWTTKDILVIVGNRTYSSWDYYDLFNDIGYPQGYTMFQQVVNLTGSLPPPGVTTYCYYGADVKTPLQFVYQESNFPNEQPTIVYGSGDGTVNENSLTSCERWKDQQTQPVYLKGFSGESHFLMVMNSAVINAIQDIVSSPTSTILKN